MPKIQIIFIFNEFLEADIDNHEFENNRDSSLIMIK
jgi:hypothetical protein